MSLAETNFPKNTYVTSTKSFSREIQHFSAEKKDKNNRSECTKTRHFNCKFIFFGDEVEGA